LRFRGRFSNTEQPCDFVIVLFGVTIECVFLNFDAETFAFLFTGTYAGHPTQRDIINRKSCGPQLFTRITRSPGDEPGLIFVSLLLLTGSKEFL